ncbi:MAG TPA: hypothetical protein PLW83_06025, partial [Deltaproteobacteria bacterium]|nr:hypothetical protein [Deltaproteobacteria bacterium]
EAMRRCIEGLGARPETADREAALVAVLASSRVDSPADVGPSLLRVLLQETRVRSLLGFNEYGATWWFVKESMEELIAWLAFCSALAGAAAGRTDDGEAARLMAQAFGKARDLMKTVHDSQYQADRLAELLETSA